MKKRPVQYEMDDILSLGMKLYYSLAVDKFNVTVSFHPNLRNLKKRQGR